MATSLPGRGRPLTVAACAAPLALLLAACGGSGSTGSAPDAFTVMTLNENSTQAAVLESLAAGACADENAALPLEITQQAQASVDQQIQLLAGQDALPALFPANTPDLVSQLAEAGQVGDVGEALSGTDAADAVLDAAASSVEGLYDGHQYVLPVELNIEGIWYNSALLEDNGIAVPTTWDELVDAFATLEAAGVQPIAQAGAGGDGWGISRWIGMYLYRTLGADALQQVADGSASLTDADHVAAAQAVADLGTAGYFGASPASVDYATALNTFATGKAGFIYMGSWALSTFTDTSVTTVPTEDIGFMAFPAVDGGAGSADQYAVNTGTSLALSSAVADDQASLDWLACIAENYGTTALADEGQITGLVTTVPGEVSDLTATVQNTISTTSDSVLWFEALFPAAATTVSQQDAGLLANGGMTAADYMAAVQAQL